MQLVLILSFNVCFVVLGGLYSLERADVESQAPYLGVVSVSLSTKALDQTATSRTNCLLNSTHIHLCMYTSIHMYIQPHIHIQIHLLRVKV